MPSLSSEIVLGTVAMEITSVIEGIKHFRASQVLAINFLKISRY
jgi:hypothetical protein